MADSGAKARADIGAETGTDIGADIGADKGTAFTGGRSADAIAVDIAIRLGLLGVFSYWSLTVVAPFLTIVIWAVILAVAIYPLHQWLAAQLGGRETLASIVITLMGLAIILGPAVALAVSLIENIQTLTGDLKSGSLAIPVPPESIQGWPLIGNSLYAFWNSAATNLEAVLTAHRSVILSTGGSILGRLAGAAGSVLAIGVSVIIAGFLYSHGPVLAEGIRAIARRVVAERGDAFIDIAGTTIRNVSRGVIGIALLQSMLAGIGILLVGIPAAGILTFIVLILCVVQIGPALVLIPLAIWSWTQYDTTTALAFTIYVIPVCLIDNILKPIVMARGLQTPMLVILVGVLGGTVTHGLIGLFLGPVVLAVFYDLARGWVTLGAKPAAAP
jgi:predicted PurR-regulated permease PerM